MEDGHRHDLLPSDAERARDREQLELRAEAAVVPIPHEIKAVSGTSQVILRPASAGTGVKAGGAVADPFPST